jgi:hypothetical protein
VRATAPPGGRSTPIPSNLADEVNAKLRAMIPNDKVTFEHKQVIGDLSDAIARAEAEYNQRLAPPPSVLERALYIVNGTRTANQPDSVTYVLKQYRILGFQICVGWRIVAHPLGGGPPDSYYAFGACNGAEFAPPWAHGLATPVPRPSRSPLAP